MNIFPIRVPEWVSHSYHNRMGCKEVLDQMEEAFLNAPDAPFSRDISAHLDDCSACRDRAGELHLLREDLRELESLPPPSPEWIGNLRSRVQRKTRPARIILLAPLAAGLLLALFLGFLAFSDTDIFPHPHSLGHFGNAFSTAASPADDIAIDERHLYVINRLPSEPGIRALDAETGDPRWQSSIGEIDHLHAGAGLLFGLKATENGKQQLVALDRDTGRLRWVVDAESSIFLPPPDHPIATDQTRVFWTDGPTLRCHDTRTGALQWLRTFSREGLISGPVPHEEGLLLATGRRLYRLAPLTGKTTDRLPLKGRSTSGFPLLALSGDTAYCLRPRKSFHSTLTCIDLSQWKTRWDRVADHALSLLAVDEAVILRRQNLSAFDPLTGNPLWEREAEGCGPLAAVSDTLWFVDTRETGSLVALHPRSGETAWREDGIRSCDAFRQSGDRGYVKTREGRILAWAFPSPSGNHRRPR